MAPDRRDTFIVVAQTSPLLTLAFSNSSAARAPVSLLHRIVASLPGSQISAFLSASGLSLAMYPVPTADATHAPCPALPAFFCLGGKIEQRINGGRHRIYLVGRERSLHGGSTALHAIYSVP